MLHTVPDPKNPSWLAAVRRGETAATRAFVRHFESQVLRCSAGYCDFRTIDVVEDLGQETFVRALSALPRFRVDGPAKVSTWLLTITTRRAFPTSRATGRDRSSRKKRRAVQGVEHRLRLANAPAGPLAPAYDPSPGSSAACPA